MYSCNMINCDTVVTDVPINVEINILQVYFYLIFI